MSDLQEHDVELYRIFQILGISFFVTF